MTVCVAILLTWSISGAAVGDLKAYKTCDACNPVAARHTAKANTEPVTCEEYPLAYVTGTLIPTFKRSVWTREGVPVQVSWVKGLQ